MMQSSCLWVSTSACFPLCVFKPSQPQSVCLSVGLSESSRYVTVGIQAGSQVGTALHVSLCVCVCVEYYYISIADVMGAFPLGFTLCVCRHPCWLLDGG